MRLLTKLTTQKLATATETNFKRGVKPRFLRFFKEKKVLKNIWLLSLIVFLTGCLSIGSGSSSNSNQSARARYIESSMEEQYEAGHWVSGPLNGRFIVIGVSGRLSRPDDEIEAAKLDAAHKVAMYHGIHGSVEFINTTGSGGFFDYSADSKLDLQYDQNFGQYLDRLTFDPEKDIIRIPGAVFIRFQYNTSGLSFNYFPDRISNNRPSWVNSRDLPQFDGYTTVVGHAGRRSRLRDTISASYQSAAAGLIETASFSVESAESTGYNLSSFSTVHIQSQGRLSNFKVLAIWINPETEAVSTLAVARVSR